MNNKKTVKNLAIYLGIPIVILFIIFFMFGNNLNSGPKVLYSDVLNYFETEQVKEYKLDLGTGEMVLTLNDEKNTKLGYEVPNISLFYDAVDEYIAKYNEHNPENKMVQDVRRPVETSWLVSMLPTIVMLILLVAIWAFMWKKMAGGAGGGNQMNFGKARVKSQSDEKRKWTFADVAGADEEKEELREVVEFLKRPQKFNELGARIPKGV